MANNPTLSGPRGQEHRVQSAEGERVRHRDVDLSLPSDIRHDIEITVGIDLLEIGGWRDCLPMNGKRGHRHLQRTGGTQSVTEHGLAGRHRNAPDVRPEDVSQSCRLRSIVLPGSGAMRVDVVYVIRFFSRVLERGSYGPCGSVGSG